VQPLSSTSINRTLNRALIRLAPNDMEFTEIPIGGLPLYNPDSTTTFQFSPGLFSDDGDVSDESTAAFVTDHIVEFRTHVERVLAVLPRG
jgi:chromate reductase